MKEATGDLGMTIIVIVGIAAVLVIGRTVVWPLITGRIEKEINETDTDPGTYDTTYNYPVNDYFKI